MNNLRNIGIIAHVDHGKTTLVDALLRQSQTKLNKEAAEGNLIMDSNELERERGITIFSKNASVIWKDTKINIIDTPGQYGRFRRTSWCCEENRKRCARSSVS